MRWGDRTGFAIAGSMNNHEHILRSSLAVMAPTCSTLSEFGRLMVAPESNRIVSSLDGKSKTRVY